MGFDAEGAAQRVAAEPDVWTDGSLVEDKVSGTSSSGSGFFSGHPGQLWADRRWGHLDDDVGSDTIIKSCRGYRSVPGPLQNGQSAEFWGSFLLSRPLMAFTLMLTIWVSFVMLVACWMAMVALVLLSFLRMVILLCLLVGCFRFRVWTKLGFLRLRVMLMRVWFWMAGFESWIAWETMPQMRRLTLVAGGLMLVVWSVAPGDSDAAPFFFFFLMLPLELLLIMRMEVVLRLIFLFGQPVHFRRDAGWCMLRETVLFCLGLLVFGRVSGSHLLLLLSLLMMLGLGHIQLGSWLNGLLFWDVTLACGWADLGVGGVPLLRFSFCTTLGWREACLREGRSPVSEAWTPNFSADCSVWSRH